MDTAEVPTSSVADTSPDPDTLPPLWHEDGDIILMVLANDKTYRFRVHTLVLSLQSPVFKDMFQLAMGNPPAKGAECPTVTLHDPVEDVRVFLNALYQGLGLFGNPDILTFDGALALLRLSHKYQNHTLRDGVIRLLKESWPMNWSDYNSANLTNFTTFLAKSSKARILECIKLINTARLTEVPVLLPTAFYELAHSNFNMWNSDNLTELLSPEDFLALIKGKQNIVHRMAVLCNVETSGKIPILWSAHPKVRANIFSLKTQCDPPNGNYARMQLDGKSYCSGVFQTLYIRLGNRLLNGLPISFDMAGSELWGVNALLKPQAVCNSCSLWLSNLVRNKEEEIWHNVPLDFGLPPIDLAEYSRQADPRRRF